MKSLAGWTLAFGLVAMGCSSGSETGPRPEGRSCTSTADCGGGAPLGRRVHGLGVALYALCTAAARVGEDRRPGGALQDAWTLDCGAEESDGHGEALEDEDSRE